MGANTRQVAGEHYKKYGEFQVWDAWDSWNLDAFAANIIKYVMRTKGGAAKRLEDLDKAEHYLQKYKELLADRVARQSDQFNQANLGSWNLTPTQAKIVRCVSYGDLMAKLELLDLLEPVFKQLREEIIQQEENNND